MLLWAGWILIVLGVAALPLDRRIAHFLYDHISQANHTRLNAVTHFAKAGHWLGAAILALAVAAVARQIGLHGQKLEMLANYSLAFIASLTVGSAVLHAIKLVLGRRRPRDDMEMGLYGFVPFAFNTNFNSFPSGHALTIFCVAVILTCVTPMLWPFWFGVAAFLAGVRALLTAHFLSDVLIGGGIGIITAREVLVLVFKTFAPAWY
jgi:membrane-associated phospholipid phosphatase